MTTNPEEIYLNLKNLQLEAGEFHHVAHVQVAWYLLTTLPRCEAIQEFVGCIQKFADLQGASNLYHETITQFFLSAIHHRLQQSAVPKSWQTFATENQDLLDGKRFLANNYHSETLAHPAAKRHFVLPDKSTHSPANMAL